MKNKKCITYSRKEIIDNPQLLLNKFEYEECCANYDNFFDDKSKSLIYYFKITHKYILYYRYTSYKDNKELITISKVKNDKLTLLSWFSNRSVFTFF